MDGYNSCINVRALATVSRPKLTMNEWEVSAVWLRNRRTLDLKERVL